MKICAVATLLLALKGPFECARKLGRIVQHLRNSLCYSIPRRFMDVAAQVGKRRRFGDHGTSHADRILDRSFDNCGADARELVLDGAPLGHVAFEVRQAIDRAGDDGFEKRLLAGEMGIDRRFAGRGRLSDLVDTRTPETFSKK